MTAPAEPAATPHVVRGLDSFRFLAAAIVAGGHGVWIPLEGIVGPVGTVPARFAAGLWGNWLHGGFAVAVFFLISGFCIHYPDAGPAPRRFSAGDFLIKRFVRIGLPVAVVVIPVAWFGGAAMMGALHGVLWTIVCELIYYALYPILLPLLRGRWRGAVLVSSLISVAMLAAWPRTMEPFSFRLTFLFCAPAWLLGALMAERYRSGALFDQRFPPLWLLRLALPAAAIASNFAFYHAPIRIPMTWADVAFVPLGYVWLAAEIQRLRDRAPNPWLERFGLASYTMYLIHKPLISLFHMFFAAWPLWLFHGALAAALGVITYLFYRIVEAPSHGLAKWLGAKWGEWRSPKTGFPTDAPEPMRAPQEN